MENKQIVDDVQIRGCGHYWNGTCHAYTDNTGKFLLCVNSPHCYFKQLALKEQECEKLYIQLKADEEYHKEEENTLRKIIKNKEERNIELYKENNKLKQTLTEIKEIAEKQVKRSPDGETFARPEIKQILQKISEVV